MTTPNATPTTAVPLPELLRQARTGDPTALYAALDALADVVKWSRAWIHSAFLRVISRYSPARGSIRAYFETVAINAIAEQLARRGIIPNGPPASWEDS
jgi:hypothetical protein